MKIKACKSAGLRLCRSPIRRPSRIGRFYVGVLMARVTVEDCIEKVENRFDLVLLAAHRSPDFKPPARYH